MDQQAATERFFNSHETQTIIRGPIDAGGKLKEVMKQCLSLDRELTQYYHVINGAEFLDWLSGLEHSGDHGTTLKAGCLFLGDALFETLVSFNTLFPCPAGDRFAAVFNKCTGSDEPVPDFMAPYWQLVSSHWSTNIIQMSDLVLFMRSMPMRRDQIVLITGTLRHITNSAIILYRGVKNMLRSHLKSQRSLHSIPSHVVSHDALNLTPAHVVVEQWTRSLYVWRIADENLTSLHNITSDLTHLLASRCSTQAGWKAYVLLELLLRQELIKVTTTTLHKLRNWSPVRFLQKHSILDSISGQPITVQPQWIQDRETELELWVKTFYTFIPKHLQQEVVMAAQVDCRHRGLFMRKVRRMRRPAPVHTGRTAVDPLLDLHSAPSDASIPSEATEQLWSATGL